MPGIEGLGSFGINPLPGDDLLKQARLADIKTRAGKSAYLVLYGNQRVEKVMSGISKACGALRYITKVLEEETGG